MKQRLVLSMKQRVKKAVEQNKLTKAYERGLLASFFFTYYKRMTPTNRPVCLSLL